MYAEPLMGSLGRIVVPKIMNLWEQLAEALYYDDPIIAGIKHQHRDDPRQCCLGLFRDWRTTNNGKEAGLKTWSTLFDTIKDFDLIADDIREEMVAKVKQLKSDNSK